MANANRDTIIPLIPAALAPALIGLLLEGVSRLLLVGIGAVAGAAMLGLFVQGALVSARTGDDKGPKPS